MDEWKASIVESENGLFAFDDSYVCNVYANRHENNNGMALVQIFIGHFIMVNDR